METEATALTTGSMAGIIAGTPVHTDHGLKSIEDIQIGDRVLAQTDVPGEMAYRTVTNTFALDDKAIWVVKYVTSDPNAPKPDDLVFHLYGTKTPPFWVKDGGWLAARRFRDDQGIVLANGRTARVEITWPVIRTPVPRIGWVSADMLGSHDGIEHAHVVDFRHGCNLWHYPRWHKDQAKVPYCELYALNLDDHFDSSEFYKIFNGDDRHFKARAYNLEVEGNGGYCVGELGVLFKSFRTPSETVILDQIEQGKTLVVTHDFAAAAEQFELAAHGAESLALHSLASEAWRLRAEVFRRIHDFPQSVETARRAGHFAQQAGDRSRLAQSLVVAGEALRALGRSDEAASTLDSALVEAKASGNLMAAGGAFYFQALLHDDAGRYHQCIEAAEAAVVGASVAGDRVIANNALERKANALKALGRYDEALTTFVDAHKHCQIDNNPFLAALAWAGKAEVLGMMGHGAEARQTSDEALLAAHRTNHPIAIASALIMRGELLERLEPGAFIIEFLTAYHAADKGAIADIKQRAKAGLARTVRNVRSEDAPADGDPPLLTEGRKAFCNADYELALTHFTEAAAQAEVVGDEHVAAKAAIGRSDALRRLDRESESLAAADAAMAKAGVLDDRHLRASACLARGKALWTGNINDAVAAFDAALHESKACGDRSLAAEALHNKAELLRTSQRFDEAKSLLDEALDDAASTGALGIAAWCYLSKGWLRSHSYEFEYAFEYFDIAALLTGGNDDPRLAAYVHYYKGYALQKLNRFHEAPTEYELALALGHRAGLADLVAELEKRIETCRSFFSQSALPQAEPQHGNATSSEDPVEAWKHRASQIWSRHGQSEKTLAALIAESCSPELADRLVIALKQQAASRDRKIGGTSLAIGVVLLIVSEMLNRAGGNQSAALATALGGVVVTFGLYTLTRIR